MPRGRMLGRKVIVLCSPRSQGGRALVTSTVRALWFASRPMAILLAFHGDFSQACAPEYAVLILPWMTISHTLS